jgi:hypothetical protein
MFFPHGKNALQPRRVRRPLGAAQFIFQSGNTALQFGYLVLYVLELCIPTQHERTSRRGDWVEWEVNKGGLQSASGGRVPVHPQAPPISRLSSRSHRECLGALPLQPLAGNRRRVGDIPTPSSLDLPPGNLKGKISVKYFVRKGGKIVSNQGRCGDTRYDG